VNEVGLVLRAGVSEALDGDLASGQFVASKVHITEAPASETPDDAIFLVEFFADEVCVHGEPPLLFVIGRTQAVLNVEVYDEIKFFIGESIVTCERCVNPVDDRLRRAGVELGI
jgi:hypothetical protein